MDPRGRALSEAAIRLGMEMEAARQKTARVTAAAVNATTAAARASRFACLVAWVLAAIAVYEALWPTRF